MRIAVVCGLLAFLTVAPRALAAAGDLDPSFGSGGKTVVGGAERQEASAVALAPGGDIVVAGTRVAVGSSDVEIALLTPRGTLDTSYGNGVGLSLADLGGDDYAFGVAVEPSGKIIAAGRSNAGGNYNMSAVRVVPPAGTLDPAFNGTGKAFVDFGTGSHSEADGAVLQPDGKLVLAGGTDKNGDNDFAVARLKGDGTIDGSFGIMGTSVGGFTPGSNDGGHAVALQPDGRIVEAGFTRVGARDDVAVDRLTVPDGNFDSSFGTGGTAFVDFGDNSFGNAVALQPDGKIVVAGSSGPNGTPDFALTRLLPNGSVDGSFGGSGRVLVDSGGDDFAHAVAVQPDGKIVVAGDFGDHFGVARLNGDGTLDGSFGSGGKTSVDFGGAPENAAGMALQPDGGIVVAGYTRMGSTENFAVARLLGTASAPPGGGGPGADAVITRLGVHPRAFRAAPKGAAVAARRKAGTTVSYTDSLPATTTFTVLRPLRGVKDKRGRCVKRTKRRRGKRCTRFNAIGHFTHRDVAGGDHFHFTGRVHHRKLPPARYRLRAIPRVGTRAGAAVTASFRVVK